MTDMVFDSMEEAADEVVALIHRGGATAAEFDMDGLLDRLVRKNDFGYVLDTSTSFWVVAEDFAV